MVFWDILFSSTKNTTEFVSGDVTQDRIPVGFTGTIWDVFDYTNTRLC